MGMDFLNYPLDKREQLDKIIQDTDEIINNFKEITEIMAKRLDKSEKNMMNLGKNIVHEITENEEINSFGKQQVRFLL